VQATIDGGLALWPDRCRIGGRLVVLRQPGPAAMSPTWLQRRGREWRLLDRPQQWVLSAVATTGLASPFSVFSTDAHALGMLAVAAGWAGLLWRSREPRAAPLPAVLPEAALAASGSPEAQVAAAATRAWDETLREPSWRSAHLASSRAVVDGQAEVDGIVEVALRVHAARAGLGRRPGGPAGEHWDEQQAALDRATGQLGVRADALIRYRDQAAALTVELANLRDLERMERTAVVVDGLTIEMAVGAGHPHGGPGCATAGIEAVRSAVAELVELMTRTRVPLTGAPVAPRRSGT